MEQWPESFVYVCNASRASLVNILPMVHAGIDRIEELIIFCGARSLHSKDANEIAEAIDPANRLRRNASQWSKGRLSGKRISVFPGDATDIAKWLRHMTAVFERPGAEKLPVIYNVKGGTKEMGLGGAIGAANRDFWIVTVTETPVGVQVVRPDGQKPLARHGELTLADYLAAYGFIEKDATVRFAAEAMYAANRDRIATYANRILPKPPSNLTQMESIMRGLYRIIEPLHDSSGRHFYPGTISAAGVERVVRKEVLGLLEAMDGFLGCRLGPIGDTLDVTQKDALRFMSGGWFEAYLFNQLTTALQGTDGAQLYANLHLAHAHADGLVGPDMAELDIVLLVNSQLHIIEAKTSSMTTAAAKRNYESSIAQSHSIQTQLVGQTGKILVCNPRDDEASVRKEDEIGVRPQRAGRELFLGAGAVDALIVRAKELVAAAS